MSVNLKILQLIDIPMEENLYRRNSSKMTEINFFKFVQKC